MSFFLFSPKSSPVWNEALDTKQKWLLKISLCLFVLSSLVLILSGCGLAGGSSPAPSGVTVVGATDLGTIATNSDILGRDGAYSALFQGQSIWLYGDTFLANADAEDRTLLSDSWSYTSDLNAQDGIGGFQERLDSLGAPTMILPETSDEQAFNAAHNSNNCQQQPCGARWALWPSSIVVDPVANRALIFYMVVNSMPGDFNFQGVGSSVAIWDSLQDMPQRPSFNPAVVPDHPDLMFNQNEPNFGSAALISGGMLYIYGCGIPTNSTDKGCRLGRVNPANVQDRSAWTFYTGNGNWSSQLSDAVSAFNGNDILSVSWNSYLQRYVAIYNSGLSQNVMLRTASNPEGPWSDESLAFTALPPAQGFIYDAHSHPEYDGNGGQIIYVTYSRSTPAAFSSEVRLVAVTLQSKH